MVAALSPSRASDFKQCPLLYRFRVIDRLPSPPSPAAARGTLVHAVLERLFDLPAGDRQVVRRSQRPWLLGLVAICVAGAVVWLWLGGAPPALAVTITAVLTGVVVVALLSVRWKVSAHTATYAAAVTVLGFEQPALAAVLALGIPLVGWARVRAGRHSLGQVLGGAAVGILVAAMVVGALD